MPRWRILIPVMIVAAVGVIAYMQIAPKQSDVTEQPLIPSGETEPVDVKMRPLGVTGDEDIGTQADVMVNELLRESTEDESVEGDGVAEIEAATSNGSDVRIFDIEYYAE